MNYANWLQRAIEFMESLRRLPGTVKVEIEVAPPLPEDEIRRLVQSCRLPVPEPVRRFWSEASAHCHCTYWWDTPSDFHKQLAIALPEGSTEHIVVGGPDFLSPHDFIEVADCCQDWANLFRNEFPRAARYWDHSLPLISLGTGDYVGLYVRDGPDDPPVVYMCHDGGGGSRIIACTFDELLTIWEQFSYIGIDILRSFVNPRTRLLDPDTFPVEREAVRALLAGEVRSDLVKPPFAMTEGDWLSCDDPHTMLKWLEKEGRLDTRKLRLFCCACCRRVRDQMGEWGWRAVEVAERFADGQASQAELDAARTGLRGGPDGSRLEQESRPSLDTFDPVAFAEGRPAWPIEELECFMNAHKESMQFAKSQGLMHYAAYNAVDARTFISWTITDHLDELELHAEEAAHTDLIRHIFGDPFRPAALPGISQTRFLQLAERLYGGDACSEEMRAALQDAGHQGLAEHFQRPDHPKGCWALDLILGR